MIAGIGFAQMAWKEANRRHGTTEFWPHPRIEDHFMSNTEIEYYRILDKAAASWPAFYGERLSGICPRVSL